MKKRKLLFFHPSLVLLCAIMAVMKAHLSPSQHSLIIHIRHAVALDSG